MLVIIDKYSIYDNKWYVNSKVGAKSISMYVSEYVNISITPLASIKMLRKAFIVRLL